MQKLFFTIVAFIYLISIIGISVQQHFCMNKLVGWSFFQQKKDRCEKCGMGKYEKRNGCCKDVKFKVKNEHDQFKSFVSILFEKKEPPHNRDLYVYEPELKVFFTERFVALHRPPNLISVPLFILNKIILI